MMIWIEIKGHANLTKIELTVFRNQWLTNWRLIQTFETFVFLSDELSSFSSELVLLASSICIAIDGGSSFEVFAITWKDLKI